MKNHVLLIYGIHDANQAIKVSILKCLFFLRKDDMFIEVMILKLSKNVIFIGSNFMKQRKIWICVLVGAMLCGVTYGQLKDQQKEMEDEIGIVLPLEKPNVTQDQKADFRKNRKYESFFKLRDETEKLFKERELYLSKTNPKEIRHYKPKVESLEKRIPKMRKKFYQEARRMRQPLEKDYAKLKAMYDDLTDKASKAEKAGNDAKAMKFSQDADKYTGKIETLKTSIDILNSFLFFDEFTPIMDPEMEKVQKISEEGVDVKKLKKTKTKKEKAPIE